MGQMLSKELAMDFLEGDDYHSPENREKMSRGRSLTEEDRLPWLENIRKATDPYLIGDSGVIVSCSALSRRSRQVLGVDRPGVQMIYLYGTESVLAERMLERKNHFMPVSLLRSQLDILEEPCLEEALFVSVDASPDHIFGQILSGLRES